MIEVQPHLVTVLADTALHGDELDEARCWPPDRRPRRPCPGAEKKDLACAQELIEAAARYRAAQKLRGKR